MRIRQIAWPLLAAGTIVSCFNGGGSVDTTPNIPAGGSAGSGSNADGGLLDDAGQGGTEGGVTITVPPGLGVGEGCEEDDECRRGLACVDNLCEPSGMQGEGEPCVIGPECAAGLRCLLGSCTTAGDGEAGDPCQTDAECGVALRCALVGLSLQCAPEGTVDVGGACTNSLECYSGLACSGGSCVPNPTGLPFLPTGGWSGVECEAPASADEDLDSRAYFEVPGVNSPAGELGDYFRLPFPNDARIGAGGRLDLGEFPTPGPEPLGVDALQLYVNAIEAGETGWGVSPTVIFRFSNGMDYDTFYPTRAANGDFDPNAVNPIQWVDVTEGTDEFGQSRGLTWSASGGRSNYVCYNSLSIRRPDGAPLQPGHTYAVFLRSVMRGANGQPVVRSPQLAQVLANAAPNNATLANVHGRFAPFRAYLQSEGIAANEVINATVFTIAPTRDLMSDLAAAVEDTAVPTSSDWVLCDDGVASPCPQAEGNRACPAANPAFDEYHALVELPIFQAGEAPYQSAGGNIVTSGPVRTEDVCISLTVPKGVDAPASGWPLVVSGHGTGGSFRSHVNASIAGVLSSVELSNPPAPLADGGVSGDDTVAFAVLGFDAVSHGPRRGGSMESPDNLFFNFLNPAAARGNPLQGAADLISIGRFAQNLSRTAQQSGGSAFSIDPERIVYLGHSQGAMHGSLALPYADMYKAAVLSGNGASIIHALLTKKSPVNIAQIIPFLLQDQTVQNGAVALPGREFHPGLALIGQWIDPADPQTFARQIGFEPLVNHTPKHVFQTYGLGDTFAPPLTMRIYAFAANVAQAARHSSVPAPDPDNDPFAGVVSFPGSVRGNHTVGGDSVTLALRQYAPPEGSDGHFVAFEVDDANTDVVQFLGMAANGQVPTAGITAD